MQDLPDFENASFNSGSPMREYHPRPGVEPIPAFDATTSVTLQIEVMRETYEEIMRVVLDNEWEREDGLRNVLLSGLGYLDARERLASINRAATGGDPNVASRLDALVQDLASYHQQYSVMKFKAFKLYKVNQVLEFNISGLRETERMWEAWAARMRKQHSELQTEVIRLRSLMGEFKLDWDVPTEHSFEPHLPAEQPLVEDVRLEAPVAAQDAAIVFYKEQPRISLWQRIKHFFAADDF